MIDLLRIPDVKPDMLLPEFWIDRAVEPDKSLLLREQIQAFNERVYTKLDLPYLQTIPETLTFEDVLAHTTHYKVPESSRYHVDGQQVDSRYFEQLIVNATLDSRELPKTVRVQFGLAVRPTCLRAFPTDDLITDTPYEIKTDVFQETTLDVGSPVAALTNSRDGKWAFCITLMYKGWIPIEDVAFGERDAVIDYTQSGDWIICRVSRGLVGLERGGGITPQMGTRLPLIEETDTLYRVRIPRKDSHGALCFADGFIPKADNHFQRGYSPFTIRNLLESAFSLLGEMYAWGGSRMGIFGRDCSRLVQDSYALCGLHLPRNSSQQGKISQTAVAFSPDTPPDQRKAQLIESATPGDLIFLPGHVVMYLGHVDGEPYAIHARGGDYMRVLVSTLDLSNIISRLTHVVSIR